MGLDMYLEKVNRNAADCINLDLDELKISSPTRYAELKPYISIEGEGNYQYESLAKCIGSWRKANQIHNWMVSNVQGGNDDCQYYEVSEAQLRVLLILCMEIQSRCQLVKGRVKNGYTYSADGERLYSYQDGYVMTNAHVAARLLPSCDGFFFGSTEYDEFYMEDIESTIEIIHEALKTDFEKEAIYYCSSW